MIDGIKWRANFIWEVVKGVSQAVIGSPLLLYFAAGFMMGWCLYG